MMHWIVQENVCREAKWDELIHQLERLQIPHSIHTVVPFSGELIPAADPASNKVWCMGSLSMLATCRANGWTPGCVDLGLFDFNRQRMALGPKMLNDDAMIATFWDIQSNRVPIYAESFVRPLDDSKLIKGTVMSAFELIEWAQDMLAINQGDTSILIARPKKILSEARFWVVGGRIVTKSLYKRGDMILHDENVERPMEWFAHWIVEELNRKVSINTYCLDVCDIGNNEYRVVEFNNINSSGFYACNIQKLVSAIEGHYN